MTLVLERLEVLVHRLPQEAAQVPPPRQDNTQNQLTTLHSNVAAYGHAELRENDTGMDQPQPDKDAAGTEELDSASSRGDTPRGPSPLMEGTAITPPYAPCDGYSSDEMESWHSAPLPGYEAAAAAGMMNVNTYCNIRLADIVRADPTGHRDNEADTSGTRPEDEQAEANIGVGQPEHTLSQQATPGGDMPATRTLKDWIDDIHGRGGEPRKGRPVVDSPISHLNSWVRVSTPSTADRGRVSSPEASMATGDEPPGPETVQGWSPIMTYVFEGGGDNSQGTPVAPAWDNRPITRRAYIVRVDHIKRTVPPTPMIEPWIDIGQGRESPGGTKHTTDIQGVIFDGGGGPTTDGPSASSTDSQPVRACTVRLRNMRDINNVLKGKRDSLNADKLKLCVGATQSEDDVADE